MRRSARPSLGAVGRQRQRSRDERREILQRSASCLTELGQAQPQCASVRPPSTAAKRRLHKSKSSPGFKNLPPPQERNFPPATKNAWGEDCQPQKSKGRINFKPKAVEVNSDNLVVCCDKRPTDRQVSRPRTLRGKEIIKLSVCPKPRSRASQPTQPNVFIKGLESHSKNDVLREKITTAQTDCGDETNIGERLTINLEANSDCKISPKSRDGGVLRQHLSPKNCTFQTRESAAATPPLESVTDNLSECPDDQTCIHQIEYLHVCDETSIQASQTQLRNNDDSAIKDKGVELSHAKDFPHSALQRSTSPTVLCSAPERNNAEARGHTSSNFAALPPPVLQCHHSQDAQKRTLRKQFRFTGYRPHGVNKFVLFKTMFTKPAAPVSCDEPCSSDKCASHSHEIAAKVATLSINDQEKIESTRQMLKEKLRKHEQKNSNLNKIPLSIFIEPKCENLDKENDSHDDEVRDFHPEEVFQGERASSNPAAVDLPNSNGSAKERGNFHLPRANLHCKANRRQVTAEISTQVALASPVHSDIETLPPDILECTEQSADTLSDGVSRPQSCAKLLTQSHSVVGVHQLSTSRTPPEAKKSFPVLVTRSRGASRRSSVVGETPDCPLPGRRLSSGGARTPPRRRRMKQQHHSSPEIYLPDERCFAGVQEALALQAKLAATDVSVRTGTLLRGLLTPTQYRQLEACPLLRLYARC